MEHLFTERIECWEDWGRIFQSVPAFEKLIRHIFDKERLPQAKITHLTPGTNAVFRVGDYVVSFNGQNVATTEEILALRRELRVGDQVPVRVCRDGAYLDLTMTMMAEK